ncbi:MAG TPA: outer membrane beta-barrel protein [Kofleriaceae bacterium]
MTRSSLLVVVLSLATSQVALAQQPPQPFPQPAPATEPPPADPPPVEQPVQQPPPQPTPQPAPTPTPPAVEEPADTYRPSGFSVGIGLGYRVTPVMTFQTPDITSVRFRLPSRLTIEPRFVLSSQKAETDTGSTDTDRTSEIGAGAVVRLPWMSRGRADLEILGTLDINSLKFNPDGDDNSRRTTNFALGYGVAVNIWLWKHLNVSMSAGNSLFTIDKTRIENGIPDDVTVDTTTRFALIFDPTVLFMAHLYL